MIDYAIEVEKIYKTYTSFSSSWSRLKFAVGIKGEGSKFTALNGVTFSVRKGETVGIIGPNGSGKSTLLKIISGVTKPSSGNISLRGRVVSLLELGVGFNPDYTGLDNLFFAGKILGMSREEVLLNLDSIVEYSGIEDHVNYPVKNYSSGMYVRLAFALAIHAEPDIFIVDEALSVGDILFQQKCFRSIAKLKQRGTTILFVSHDQGLVNKLCDRAIFLFDGGIISEGKPSDVLELYAAKMLSLANEAAVLSSGEETHPDFEVRFFELSNGRGDSVNTVVSEDELSISFTVCFLASIRDVHIGFVIEDCYGNIFFETNTDCMEVDLGNTVVGQEISGCFSFCANLYPGEYTVSLGIAKNKVGTGIFSDNLLFRGHPRTLTVRENSCSLKYFGFTNLKPRFSLK